MRIKYVFKESLARNLCKSGYPIVYIRKDHKKQDKFVFMFEETEQFIRDFTALSNKK